MLLLLLRPLGGGGAPTAYIKVWLGSWQIKPVKVYMGAGPGWVIKPIKYYDGAIWKPGKQT